MEECSELVQQCAKMAKNKGVRENLVIEMADVLVNKLCIMQKEKITFEELAEVIYLKTELRHPEQLKLIEMS